MRVGVQGTVSCTASFSHRSEYSYDRRGKHDIVEFGENGRVVFVPIGDDL
jgi:hypothetical protein